MQQGSNPMHKPSPWSILRRCITRDPYTQCTVHTHRVSYSDVDIFGQELFQVRPFLVSLRNNAPLVITALGSYSVLLPWSSSSPCLRAWRRFLQRSANEAAKYQQLETLLEIFTSSGEEVREEGWQNTKVTSVTQQGTKQWEILYRIEERTPNKVIDK